MRVIGFDKVCNLGSLHADSDYLLFLNLDAALFQNTLVKSLALMQAPENKKVGICGVQLLDEKGHVSRTCARFPSVVGFILLFVFIFKIFNSFNKYAKVHAGDKSSKVFYFITLSATLVAFNVDIFSRNIFVVYLAVFAVLLHIPSIKKYN